MNILALPAPDKTTKFCVLFDENGEKILTFNWDKVSTIYSQLFVNHGRWMRAELHDGKKYLGSFDWCDIPWAKEK